MNLTAALLTVIFFVMSGIFFANFWRILLFILKTVWFLFCVVCFVFWAGVFYSMFLSVLV